MLLRQVLLALLEQRPALVLVLALLVPPLALVVVLEPVAVAQVPGLAVVLVVLLVVLVAQLSLRLLLHYGHWQHLV